MSLVRMLCNQLMPLKEGERRIGRDTAETLFTNSYINSIGERDENEKIDLNRVSEDLKDPKILTRAKRVENVSRPISALVRVGILGTVAFIGFNIVKDFPKGTYEIGPVTIRTGDDAEDRPPFCISVEDEYLDEGFSMRKIGTTEELEDQFPIVDSCQSFGDVFEFNLDE